MSTRAKIPARQATLKLEHTPNPFKVGMPVFAIKSGSFMGLIVSCSTAETAVSHWAQVAGISETVFSEDIGRYFALKPVSQLPFYPGQRLFRNLTYYPVLLGVVTGIRISDLGTYIARTNMNNYVLHHEITSGLVVIGRRSHKRV